ncbi:MAG: hypothetical protein K2Q97_03395, partial [Burkholderiaceae bacterium]|nr:hypothetical protein [Burkholderiaceae bacterium]
MLRWLFAGYLAFTAVLIGLKFGLQHSAEESAARFQQQQVATRTAAQNANALLVLTQEYILRGTARSIAQWHTAHQLLQQAVTAAAPAAEREEDLEELRDIIGNLPQ